jgi:hypothetical protein
MSVRTAIEKLAGEMQGHTRIGRKPIGVEKMLENESEVQGLPDDFVESSMTRAAKALVKMSSKAYLGAGVALGAAGAIAGRKANEDRKLGRAIRIQQRAQQQ